MITKEKKEAAAEQLRRMAQETGRLPQKADFDPVTLSRIKACLGPWPRALEYAGLKEMKARQKKTKKRNAKKKKIQETAVYQNAEKQEKSNE